MDSLSLRHSVSHPRIIQPPCPHPDGSEPFVPQKHYWLAVLLVATAIRFFMAWVIPISPEEAYHWNFARHLDWSYYDHPPMLAWAIALGRLILGDTALGVRFVPLLFSIGSMICLARLARRFYGDLASAWTILLLALNPCVLVVGGWGFPDAPLLFFWSLTMVLVWRAIETGQGAWWLGAGAALGAAMLSKYTAAFLVPSLFCFLIFSRSHRRWLASRWPYLGGVVAWIVFAPVLYWNVTHDWASFRFQSTARFAAANDFSWRAGLVFLGEQWLAILPLTLPLALVAFGQTFRSARTEERFLFWLFVPMIAFFWMFGFTPSYHVLWALPAYLALTVLMAGAVVDGQTFTARFYRARIKWITAVAGVVLAVGVVHAAWVLPRISPLREMYGWEEIAALAKNQQATLGPGAFYLAIGNRSYPCPSQLAFYLDDPAEVHGSSLLGIRNLQYQFWSHPDELLGKDAVVVLESGTGNPKTVSILGKHFQKVEPAGDLVFSIGKLPLGVKRQRRFLFFKAYGYRGLDVPQP
jgi:4-amino-4-deoxy-L-arabinose transferase-like glycosyltransferase